MIEWIQKGLVLGLFLATGCCAWVLASTGQWLLGALSSLLIIASYSILLAFEFLMLAFFGRDSVLGGTRTPTGRELIAACIREAMCTPQVFYWRQPFRSRTFPDDVGDGKRESRGVLLVHGYFCNRGLWNPWLKMLHRLNVPYLAPNLEPAFGSIGAYSASIGECVRQLHGSTGRKVVVVGHSMGGLAIRAWLADSDGGEHVHRFISIGTPHRGSWLARFGHASNAREMRPGSPWLRQLEARESGRPRVGTTCFYAQCDNIVFPAWRATLPGADNKLVAQRAHMEMLGDPAVFAEVLRWTAVGR